MQVTLSRQVKPNRPSFRGSENFQVNKSLEYASSISGSLVGLSLLGGGIGLLVGAEKDKSMKDVFIKNPSTKKAVFKHGAIGAAIGAAVALVAMPFVLNGAREKVYKKQLDYDVMGSVATKARSGELSAAEASDYLKSSAFQKMAANGAGANSGASPEALMIGSYLVGKSSGSGGSSKK